MDWVIASLIIVAAGGAIKLIKDAYEKKPRKNWIFFGELGVICLTLYIGIFARKSQSENDETSQSNLYRKMENGTSHTDTTLTKSAREIQDSADVREKRLEDSIRMLRKEKTFDPKPNIDIFPSFSSINPRIDDYGTDSFNISIIYGNYGSSFAKEFHVNYCALALLNDTMKVFVRKIMIHLNRYLIFPPNSSLGLRDSLTLIRKFTSPDETLYQCAFFCYKDSLNRRYGPIIRIFKWKYSNFKGVSTLVQDDDLNRVKLALENYKMWPSKFF